MSFVSRSQDHSLSSGISRISYPASCIRPDWGLPEYMSWVFVRLRFHILWLKWDLYPLSLLAPCLALTQWTFDKSPNLPALGGGGGQGRWEAQHVLSEGWSSLEWKPWCLVSWLDHSLCLSWRCNFTWAAGLQVGQPKPPFYHSTALPPLRKAQMSRSVTSVQGPSFSGAGSMLL